MNEILKARLAIRDYYLNTVVREIYENIGQTLSLVNMLLGTMALNKNNCLSETLSNSGKYLGRSIRDLRSMASHFYPEAELQEEVAWFHAIERLVHEHGPLLKVRISGIPQDMDPDLKLLLFSMLHKILNALKEQDRELAVVNVKYAPTKIKIVIGYHGEPTYLKRLLTDIVNNAAASELDTLQAAALIGATFSRGTSTSSMNHIILTTPLTLPTYE